jgi:hypothetical protein
MDTVVALFGNYPDANRAVEALKEAGFPRDAVSVLARESVLAEELGRDEDAQDVVETNEAATAGVDGDIVQTASASAIGGGVLGGLAGLLVGIGAVVIPGLGPVVAAGALASAIGSAAVGAGIGATAGGVLGALAGLNLNENEVQAYAEGIKRGGILVVAHAAEGREDLAQTIMTNANALDIHHFYQELRLGGWNRFDESQTPDLDLPAGWRRLND